MVSPSGLLSARSSPLWYKKNPLIQSNAVSESRDIVNTGLHFFLKKLDLMQTPVGKHSIAAA